MDKRDVSIENIIDTQMKKQKKQQQRRRRRRRQHIQWLCFHFILLSCLPFLPLSLSLSLSPRVFLSFARLLLFSSIYYGAHIVSRGESFF